MAETVWEVIGDVQMQLHVRLTFRAATADEASTQFRARIDRALEELKLTWTDETLQDENDMIDSWHVRITEVEDLG
jgi:hypothetical protein